ncbi:MAG TPA: hypothetical protein VM757_03955 [Sphingomicrobium sp.]|nr:hypothetical protein [Sphingomicrobium sp.]
MTQQLIERTVREWVSGNPGRGADTLGRLAGPAILHSAQTAEEVADALIRLAGRMEIADSRVW